MDLFEKIDLFEKMATQLSQGQSNDLGSETSENIDELPERKDTIKVRTALLKSLLDD
jgi:hypothetical protein